MPRSKKSSLLAKVNFPPYTLQMLTSRHVLVGGGGGSARTGVANGFEIFEISHNGTSFVAEEVTRYETGPNVVMNSAVYNNGKKIWAIAGQESHCQLYNIQSKVVGIENGEILKKSISENYDGLRKRKKDETKNHKLPKREAIEDLEVNNKGGKHKKLQFILIPGDSIQTDFGTAPVQRVVRINLSGTMMATGGTDGIIRLWQFPKMIKLHELEGHSKEIDDIDFSPDGKSLCTVAKDGLLFIWDTHTGKKSKNLTFNPTSDLKAVFKRCCYQNQAETSKIRLFTIANSLSSRDRQIRKHKQFGYLNLWNLDLGSVEKSVTYEETLSELAVSDDGKFVAVGTMSSGSVDMFIAFSLQKVLHVPKAHNMFITSLEFLPTVLDGPAVTSNAEAAVISVSVDNKICIHSIPFRHSLPFWVVFIFIVISICGAFVLCSYLGI